MAQKEGGIIRDLLYQLSESATSSARMPYDSEQRNYVGRALLHEAECDRNADVMDLLVMAGAQPAEYTGSSSLLDMAGDANILDILLGAGAEPGANMESSASLNAAVLDGDEDEVSRLLDAGHLTVTHGPTFCLETALSREEVARFVVTTLMARGDCGEARYWCDLLNAGTSRIEWEDGMSPLHIAAESGLNGVVSALLNRGADKDALDDQGESPLIKAALSRRRAVVDALLAAGADVEIRDERGYTALIYASCRGDVDVMKAILRHQSGAATNAPDETGKTALHHAADKNEVGAIDALVEAGADLEVKDSAGRTPFGTAASTKDGGAMRALLRHGANVHALDNDGSSLLHLACLLPDEGGMVASMEVQQGVYSRMVEAVDFLLRSGVDEKVSNNLTQTPAQQLESSPTLRLEAFEQTLLLLARAPADRAWRRRGWLTILRSRASKVRAASCDTNIVNSDSGDGLDASGCRGGKRNSSKTARRQHPAVGGGGGALPQTGNERGAGEGDSGGDLRAAVTALVDMELEGVFRAVVSFL